MPIVASMGGNAGTQTVTVAVRALAMGELTASNAFRFVAKGGHGRRSQRPGVRPADGDRRGCLVWRLAARRGDRRGHDLQSVRRRLAGTLIPLGLAKFGIDPAVSSTVFLTTVTDVIGFWLSWDWRRRSCCRSPRRRLSSASPSSGR